jgi:hypothetical protein
MCVEGACQEEEEPSHYHVVHRMPLPPESLYHVSVLSRDTKENENTEVGDEVPEDGCREGECFIAKRSEEQSKGVDDREARCLQPPEEVEEGDVTWRLNNS